MFLPTYVKTQRIMYNQLIMASKFIVPYKCGEKALSLPGLLTRFPLYGHNQRDIRNLGLRASSQ